MELKVKKLHKDAILPRKAHTTDACFDIFAADVIDGDFAGSWIFPTGIAIEIPTGYYGQLLTRSGMAREGIVVLGGVIDSGYRGEVKVIVNMPNIDGIFEEIEDVIHEYVEKSAAVAQLAILPVPECEIVEVDELSPSDRGSNGFGSTDQKEA